MNSSKKSFFKQVLATGALLAATLGAAASAQAQVVWSVGIHEPGVNVRVSNAPPAPVIVAQAPVVMHPAPVVYHPAVVHPVRPVVQPVVYEPPRYQHHPRHHHRHGWGHWRGHGHGHGHGHSHH